jgi:hypothetical protein
MSNWVKIENTDWWFRADNSSGRDPAHFHFVKGDPTKAKSDFYNRRVYTQLKNLDGSTKQNYDKGGHGGVDRNVPEDIIQKAVNQKGGNNSERVSLSEPFFGLLNLERIDSTSVTVQQGEEGYPVWGNGNPLQMTYSVTRNKENGDLSFSLSSVFDMKTRMFISPNIMLPSISISPGASLIPGTIPGLSPALIY